MTEREIIQLIGKEFPYLAAATFTANDDQVSKDFRAVALELTALRETIKRLRMQAGLQ